MHLILAFGCNYFSSNMNAISGCVCVYIHYMCIQPTELASSLYCLLLLLLLLLQLVKPNKQNLINYKPSYQAFMPGSPKKQQQLTLQGDQPASQSVIVETPGRVGRPSDRPAMVLASARDLHKLIGEHLYCTCQTIKAMAYTHSSY